ncbi:MAG: ATP-binding cassette domain-containing protein [Candidatus Symbiothrix sp.]|jgi:zinc transport system ATP-binding protein|nr:ATP-binding cassette domain-containing protein [Candidatus Symbiothrix sp.]
MNKILVDIEHLSAGYNRNPVLKDLSLQIRERDFLGITGPNGGGKTTLAKVILGLIKPTAGHIRFADKLLRKHTGYMPQTHRIDTKFPIIVAEVIASGLMAEKHLSSTEKKARVQEILTEMGLEKAADKPIGELSGGQLQRTLLGRAIINRPELLILDEPNSYIDAAFEAHFYQLLQEMNQDTAIVLISHDMDSIHSMTKNVLTIN